MPAISVATKLMTHRRVTTVKPQLPGDRGRDRSRPQGTAAVDDVAGRVLVGQPRGGAALGYSRLAVVAHPRREGLLQCSPLGVREGHRVVVTDERLELTLQYVVGLRLTGGEPRRPVGGDRLVAHL